MTTQQTHCFDCMFENSNILKL